MPNEKRATIFEGTDEIANCRISYNLDFWNGQINCNPERGKHKTVSCLPDGQYAIIWSDDNLNKHIGKVVSNEYALIEILKAKKTNLLNRKKFKTLQNMYIKRQVHYDSLVAEKRTTRVNKNQKTEIVIVTKDNNLVGIYSNFHTLKVKRIPDLQKPPKDYHCIWSVEKNGISEYSKISELFNSN